MDNDLQQQNLQAAYEEYAMECSFAMEEILAHLRNINVSLKREMDHAPICRIESRIKTYDSMIKKYERRGYEDPLSIESIKQHIHDVAGIRVVTDYIDDIDLVAKEIEKQSHFSTGAWEDYVSNPKPNGYRSLHIPATAMIFNHTTKMVPVEIQIRSKAMNLWSDKEHEFKYKNDNPSPEAEAILKEAAEFLYGFDLNMMKIRDFHKADEPLEAPET